MPTKILNQCLVNITTGRRITLPSFVECEVHQQLLFQQMEDGTYTMKFHSNAPKVKIYGVMIGRTNINNKISWWGIFIDENGNVLVRQKSNTMDYLRQDMSIPDSKAREKLDKVCGIGLWERPILIEFTEAHKMPAKAYGAVSNIKAKMAAGTWPPQN